MKNISLKLKITLWYTVAMIVVSSIVLIAMNSITTEIINRDISERIVRTVEETSHMMVDRQGRMRPMPNFPFYMRGVHMVVFDSEKNVVAGQVPFGISEKFEFTDEKLRHEIYDSNKYMVYDKLITAKNEETYWIKGMVAVNEESYAANSTFKTNAIITVIMILIAAIGGYFIISRALNPVSRIRNTAETIINSGDLSQRINIGKSADEISSLANTFDIMLSKIEASFENEKQFTSDASHELRTPVAVIISECEYMTECAENVQEFRESAHSVKRQAEKMSKLISELLTISRMDKNTLKLNFEEIDISELLSFVCEEQEEIQSKEIVMHKEIAPGITARADRGLIARLFINLISNAYQYTGEHGTIDVSLCKDGDNVRFSVRDTGIGIAPENIDKIWERFYQEDPSRTADDSGSMGLGLSMVKWIAECHGGRMYVNSTVGEGSEFVFVCPENNI